MNNKSKFTFGFYLGLLFSILGLYAGMLFPEQSKERLTFIVGWQKGLIFNIILIGIGLLIII